MKVLAILQARMSSSRLPNKVLEPILGKPMLLHQIERVLRSNRIDHLLVATSKDKTDDRIEDVCIRNNIDCYRGSLEDVLDRFYQSSKKYSPEHVVRLTGDCPLIDWRVLDQVIDKHIKNRSDYTSNTIPPSYPDGLDVEIMTQAALEEAFINASSKIQREHVTVYIRESSKFKKMNLKHPIDLSHHRWTVDEGADLLKVRQVFEALYEKNQDFSMNDILSFLKDNPNIDSLNASLRRNEGMVKQLHEEMGKFVDGKGQALYKKAKKYIPGGTQLLSKRPEMLLPELWPSYYKKVKGIEVIDLDGNKFIDMSHNAIGTCILGPADNDVNEAVIRAVTNGVSSTLNCPEEVELAELLCELHPWAANVRYARTGGEAMAIAVRIARAKTGKDKIAFCGYHGWHDWYLAANLSEGQNLDSHLLPGLSPNGVPRGLQGTAIPFKYNHFEELEAIVEENDIGLIVMEPVRSEYPKDDFLQKVRKLANKHNIILIFDEITSGFRLCSGGAHLVLGVEPDIAVFGKAISNGHPMAAVIGRKDIMSVAQETFISSTYWTDRVGPVAALTTIKKYKSLNVHEHLSELGKKVQDGWRKAAKLSGLKVHVGGIYPLSHFSFEGEQGNLMRTLFTQEMLRRGYLATSGLYLTYAHTIESITCYLQEVEQVFSVISTALKDDLLEALLIADEAHKGFKRLS